MDATDSARLPADDAGVRVLERWDAAVLIDLEEVRAFDTVGRVAELPQLDFVWHIEELKSTRNLVRVRPCAVGMKSQRLDIGRHGLWFACLLWVASDN